MLTLFQLEAPDRLRGRMFAVPTPGLRGRYAGSCEPPYSPPARAPGTGEYPSRRPRAASGHAVRPGRRPADQGLDLRRLRRHRRLPDHGRRRPAVPELRRHGSPCLHPGRRRRADPPRQAGEQPVSRGRALEPEPETLRAAGDPRRGGSASAGRGAVPRRRGSTDAAPGPGPGPTGRRRREVPVPDDGRDNAPVPRLPAVASRRERGARRPAGQRPGRPLGRRPRAGRGRDHPRRHRLGPARGHQLRLLAHGRRPSDGRKGPGADRHRSPAGRLVRAQRDAMPASAISTWRL